MINKEDYQKYLAQMKEIELSMIGVYSRCASLADDQDLRRVFLSLVEDEKRHSNMVASLSNLFL